MSRDLSALTPERRAVVEAICASSVSLRASEIAERVSSSEGSIRQMLSPLTREGYISRVSRGKYWRPGSQADKPPGPERIESNADFVDLGTDSIWVPMYPVSLGAGEAGDYSMDDIEPDGAFPLPGAWARRVGINGSKSPFAVTVRGDSMSKDFPDGAIVFGYRVEEADVEDVYALYLAGDLLVKRVRRLPNGLYQLISSNENYPPVPVNTEEVHIIGRVVGALTTI